jgi:hypothetical protein
MNKKLKIQFWKAEKALAMQILEQEGLPKRKNEGNVRVWDYIALFKEAIVLGGINEFDLHIPHIIFDTNAERDAYLDKVINAITEELFSGEGELKVGEMCEVSDDGVSWHKYRLLAILPDRYEMRFIIENGTLSWCTCTYARPIVKRIEPTLDKRGNVFTYTWEEK